MKFVSIDIETTGLDPDTCQIIEFGAVIGDTITGEISEPFHRYILPYNASPNMKGGTLTGEPYALALNKDIILKLNKPEYPECDHNYNLAPRFSEWLKENGLNKRIVIAGKNYAGFDGQFLKKLSTWGWVKAYHRVMDPTMLYMLSTDDVPPDLKTCLLRAGLADTVTHTAVEDAIQVAQLIIHGLKT